MFGCIIKEEKMIRGFPKYIADPSKKVMRTFDRLIPVGGVKITGTDPDHLLNHVDVNDIDLATREDVEYRVFADETFIQTIEEHKTIKKGTDLDRNFSVYSYVKGDLVSFTTFFEWLDNPDGYEKNDFLRSWWIDSKYQGTKYARFIILDLYILLSLSGIANKIYAYGKTTESSITNENVIVGDKSSVCGHTSTEDMNKVSAAGGSFIKIRKIITTEVGNFTVGDWDCDAYRKLDKKKFIMSVYGVDDATATKRIDSVNSAVNAISKLTI